MMTTIFTADGSVLFNAEISNADPTAPHPIARRKMVWLATINAVRPQDPVPSVLYVCQVGYSAE